MALPDATEHESPRELLGHSVYYADEHHATERSWLSDQHSVALANQRKEFTEAAEQAENRLMVLLDQERQETKNIRTKLTRDLEAMTQKSQSSREDVVALEANVRELTRANEKLESDLEIQRENCSKLEKDLEEQKGKVGVIEREFKDYKEKHRLSSDLDALQPVVAGLQAQITEQRAVVKE